MMRLVEKKIRQIVALAGRWPYRVGYFSVVILTRVFKIPGQIWIRNSYVLGSFQPGFSDLDLTCFVSDGPRRYRNQNLEESFFKIASRFQKFWPFLGEINFYCQETAKIVIKTHNSFEIRRDPELAKRFFYGKHSDMYEAAVFLLRQLEKDLVNLKNQPDKRVKKWLCHFQEIDKSLPELKFGEKFTIDRESIIDSVINAIVFLSRCWNPVMYQDVRQKLLVYIELRLANIDSFKIQKITEWDPWFFVWGAGFFSTLRLGHSRFSEDQLKFFVRQMRWELCGVLGQSFTQQQKNNSLQHLKKLYQSIQFIENVQNHAEIRELKQEFESSFLFCQS